MPECNSCKKANDPGVKFCLNCGNDLAGGSGTFNPPPAPRTSNSGWTYLGDSSLSSETEVSRTSNSHPINGATPSGGIPLGSLRPCGSCGKTDPMNEVFCLYCGASLPPVVVSAEIAKNQLAIPIPAAKKSVLGIAVAAVLVIACGVTGWMGFQRTSPSGAGVLIHATPADAAVVIQDQKGFVVKSAELNEDGIFETSNLPPGKYRIMLSADGRESELHDVELVAGRTVSLGVTKPLELKITKKEPVVAPAVAAKAEKSNTAVAATPQAVPRSAVKSTSPPKVVVTSQVREIEAERAAVHQNVQDEMPPVATPYQPAAMTNRVPGDGAIADRPFAGANFRPGRMIQSGQMRPGMQMNDGMRRPEPRMVQQRMRRIRQMMSQQGMQNQNFQPGAPRQ